MRVLATVPAKKGSESLPNKNMLKINGRSLWRMAADAGEAACDVVVVSTDYDGILQLPTADERVMFHKPKTLLCHDRLSFAWDVWRDAALAAMERFGRDYFDAHVYLEPSSPCRTPQDILDCLAPIDEGRTDSAFTVSQSPVHPSKMFEVGSDYRVVGKGPLDGIWNNLPRQLYRGAFWVKNGLCYASTTDRLVSASTIIDQNSLAVPISRPVANIDTEIDLRFAEYLIDSRKIS